MLKIIFFTGDKVLNASTLFTKEPKKRDIESPHNPPICAIPS